MKITVIGRGRVGGGLANRWRAVGHEVQALGRDGGDAADSDVLLVAVPGTAINDALGKVRHIAGKPTIDATNLLVGADGFESRSHKIADIVRGPIAKAFNLNWPDLYEQLDRQQQRPCDLYAADDAMRALAETLIRHAGYEPVYVGGIAKAALLEQLVTTIVSVRASGPGPTFYRMWAPER
jgi:predicted dinucleotide-binding enzyme